MAIHPDFQIQDEMCRNVLHEFVPRFAPTSKLVWLSVDGRAPIVALTEELPIAVAKSSKWGCMPNVILNDHDRHRRIAIDVYSLIGQFCAQRHTILEHLLREDEFELILVNAIAKRQEFVDFAEIPWSTIVWFANEPNHFIHFNGQRLLGPYPDVISTHANRGS